MKTLLFPSVALFASISLSSGALLISGVADGTQTGGNPKVIEIVSTMNGTELSDFFILRDTNGSSSGTFTISNDFQLPTGTLNAGEFFYIYGNSDSETFLESVEIGNTDTNAVLNGIANINGDDILALSTSSEASGIVDSFGLLGQDDTDFYANSVSNRQAGAPANPSGVLDGGNFTITPYSDELIQSSFGTFVVPEPSSALLGGLGLLALFRRRR